MVGRADVILEATNYLLMLYLSLKTILHPPPVSENKFPSVENIHRSTRYRFTVHTCIYCLWFYPFFLILTRLAFISPFYFRVFNFLLILFHLSLFLSMDAFFYFLFPSLLSPPANGFDRYNNPPPPEEGCAFSHEYTS